MWFKVDDGFCDHTKVIKLCSIKGWEKSIALWTLAGSWSGKQESDGNIPANVIKRLGFAVSDAQRLVFAGLWKETPDGFVFHDWAKVNPLKVDLEAKRAANKQRVDQWRKNKPGTHGVTPLQASSQAAHEFSPFGRVGSGSEISSSEPDRVEPPMFPPHDGSDAGHWLQAFSAAWIAKRNCFGYGQGSDAKACGSLNVTLDAMSPEEIAKAWGAKEAMFAAFFADENAAKAQHIFAFFVPRFTALYTAAVRIKPKQPHVTRVTE